MKHTVQSTGSLFFTSDHHFGHKNIIKYTRRPFESKEEMDEKLIENWNSVVPAHATVVNLGDMFLEYDHDRVLDILRRLNFKHMIYVFGNHESSMERFHEYYNQLMQPWSTPMKTVDFFPGYLELGIPTKPGLIVCSHYAFRVWNKAHHGSWHVYGHSHNSLPDDPDSLSCDVGVDCHDYKPISFRQLKVIMAAKTFTPKDHHGKKR